MEPGRQRAVLSRARRNFDGGVGPNRLKGFGIWDSDRPFSGPGAGGNVCVSVRGVFDGKRILALMPSKVSGDSSSLTILVNWDVKSKP